MEDIRRRNRPGRLRQNPKTFAKGILHTLPEEATQRRGWPARQGLLQLRDGLLQEGKGAPLPFSCAVLPLEQDPESGAGLRQGYSNI